jgi:hypothetical protein
VSSAIINVAQDVDEPWPLEVIGHDGKAANVTMEPGDMVLYESHSVIHGRPFPLKGRFFANICTFTQGLVSCCCCRRVGLLTLHGFGSVPRQSFTSSQQATRSGTTSAFSIRPRLT